jgi:hypothetical protein
MENVGTKITNKLRMSSMKRVRLSYAFLMSALMVPMMGFSETVGVFYDASVEQIKFAAGDIKTALASKGHTAELLSLTALNGTYANKKIVLALASNATVTSALSAQGGTAPTGLGEQAYALRTTTQGQTSFWVLGGDVTGTMYGGFQIAENIQSDGLSGSYSSQEAPFMQNRGMKLNMPLDRRIPTYVGSFKSRSTRFAIPVVWDSTFWKDLIDQQARSRYNLLSVWVHNPFPALVKTPGFEKATLPNIEGYNDGFVLNWDLDARVAYWRRIMQYAHSRGMSFYFFNWNIIVDYAGDRVSDSKKTGQYPAITDAIGNSTTKDYLSKSFQALIATYPELDGFGVSMGDNMGSGVSEGAKQSWSWDVYGKTMKSYLDANPSRKFTLIHRSLGISPETFYPSYDALIKTPNAQVDFSVKYAMAHMYSTPTPSWTSDIKTIASKFSSNKTYLTTRNDDFTYINWGDPKFVRDFLAGVPEKQVVKGMYIGADGWSPARTYHYANNFKSLNGQLEVTRRWYMEMLWARLAYNPETKDEVFKKMLALRFPTLNADNLFNAWALASRPLPKMTELIMGEWTLDHDWWPEACWSDPGRHEGFRSIQGMAGEATKVGNGGTEPGTTVANGSKLCDIAKSAANACGTAKNSYMVANEMQADAEQAISLTNGMSTGGKQENDVAIRNIRQMAFLSDYYAHKIRGATYRKAQKKDSAIAAMGTAYCHWISYTRAMEEMYEPDTVREVTLSSWKFGDAAVLKEYTDLGGTGTPKCVELVGINGKSLLSNQKSVGIPHVIQISNSGLTLNLPAEGEYSLSLYSAGGKLVYKSEPIAGAQGEYTLRFKKKMRQGIYVAKINAGTASYSEKKMIAD